LPLVGHQVGGHIRPRQGRKVGGRASSMPSECRRKVDVNRKSRQPGNGSKCQHPHRRRAIVG
jgi:hypothetical protein